MKAYLPWGLRVNYSRALCDGSSDKVAHKWADAGVLSLYIGIVVYTLKSHDTVYNRDYNLKKKNPSWLV